jgi:hypothetical protein
MPGSSDNSAGFALIPAFATDLQKEVVARAIAVS